MLHAAGFCMSPSSTPSSASQLAEQLSAAAIVAAGLVLAMLLLATLASVRMRAWLQLLVGRRIHAVLHSRLARPDASQKFTRDLSEGTGHMGIV